MSGTRFGLGRIIAIGVALAMALLLLGAREAGAAKYTVAQCGWHVDADADWADTTGGSKFRPDAYCATPAGADPFDGAHLKSFTRGGSTVSGTRFARWRWAAPPGTGITRISGTWWHTLHDGFEQRIGSIAPNGSFDPFATAAATDVTLRDFVAGFSAPVPAIEDRLLCARAESRWCSLEPGSWSGLRAVTITLEDFYGPGAGVGGQLTTPGWHRGNQEVSFWGTDIGGGVRFGETLLDGARVALTEYSCAKASIGGEWRATRMRPCELSVSGTAGVATTNFSDGPHVLGHCATDFAGNRSLRHPGIGPDRQQRARASARSLARRWRIRLAPHQRLRPVVVESRPGARQRDRRRLLADHRAGRVRQRRRASAPAATSARCATCGCPAPGSTRLRSGCATRPATRPRGRPSRCRCASTMSRRASPSPPPRGRACRMRFGRTSPTPTPELPAALCTTGDSAASSGWSCPRSSSSARWPAARR